MSSPSMQSLDGLIPPSEMEFVALQEMPGLKDISALRYVTSISNQLWIERTPIEALPFEALVGVTQTHSSRRARHSPPSVRFPSST